MNTLNKQKLVWVAGAVIAAIYFGPSFIRAHRPEAPRPEVPLNILKNERDKMRTPATGTPSPAGTSAVAPAANPFTPPTGAFMGTWQGNAPVPGQGLCSLKLEVRRNAEDATHFSGYSVLLCVPSLQPVVPTTAANADAMVARFTPTSAILTGTAANGSIKFTVDKIIGPGTGNCAMTSIGVSPFGMNQIAAEWQDGSCGTGQIVLRKVGP